jgi:hypothetical protein
MRHRKTDWNRVYELEMAIYGHYFEHIGAPPVEEHPAFHPAVWSKAILADPALRP